MSIAHPGVLLVALVVAFALGGLYRRLERRSEQCAALYSRLDVLLEAMRPSPMPARMLFAAFLVGITALAVAAAGPRVAVRVPVRSGTVIFCLDTSGSMNARDVQPTRARAAKSAVREFLDAVPPGTRVGIVSFATDAQLVQSPSADLDAAREALERIPQPNGATAIGDALALANQAMPANGRRVVILLTDGVNNRGVDPIQMAVNLGHRGVAVYTVGVGSAGSEELIPGTSEHADLKEEDLRAMAADAGGTYAPARDATALRGAFRELARTTVWERRWSDAGLPFALGGGVVLIGVMLGGSAAGKWP